MTSRQLAALHAILAGLQVIAGAANLADLLGRVPAAWFVLLVGALQVGGAVYTDRTTTTPADAIRASMT